MKAGCGNYKYCPALTVMLYEAGNSTYEICNELGMSWGSIDRLCKKGRLKIRKESKYCKALAVMLYQLTDMGETKIADAVGVSHATVHRVLESFGVDTSNPKRTESKYADILKERYGDAFTLLSLGETCKSRVTIRCNKCGSTFTKYPDWRNGVSCPSCLKMQAKRNRELARIAARESCERRKRIEFAKTKVCKECGSEFHSEFKRAKYCSVKCRNKVANRRSVKGSCKSSNHRKRAKLYGVAYESGITLEKVIERDKNVCQICGKPCDKNDKRWGTTGPFYPSIDHVTALAKGGGHTWENVQLAHCICNSYKRDLENKVIA